MSEALNINNYADTGENQGDKIGLTDFFFTLMSGLIPEEVFAKNEPEAQYLASFRNFFAELPQSSLQDIFLKTFQFQGSNEQSLARLSDDQKLSFPELFSLGLCYEVEQDPMLGRCIAYLQKPIGSSRPSLSLLNSLFIAVSPQYETNFFASIVNSRSVELGLLQLLNETAPLPEQAVKIPSELALCISGENIVWPGATTQISCTAFELPESIRSQAQTHARALTALPDSILVLRCGSKKESAVTADSIAAFCGSKPIFINDDQKALPALGPVCRAKSLLPVFSYYCGPGEIIDLPIIKGYNGPILVMAGLEGSFESSKGSLSSWIIPYPTLEERKEIWKAQLEDSILSAKMAGDHIHSTSRIIELAGLAKRESINQNKEAVEIEDIRQAAWLSENSGLSALAQPVKAEVNDDALVVRPFTRQQLDLLEKRCNLRERLGEDLGATITARYQMGVKALFLGPSGTGKTLATSWLANRLGIPLYRVDLASITSKYIGDTEKNLAKLLGQAEQEEVMLLFDEADSIFGKRTDIKDSNDRFANAQTNYLLQRIETYSGVVILTSNSKARFDSAFTRRLDMMIEFPLPNPEERRAIWLSHLGSYHELSLANINQLAVQCNLTGGHIRNIVLTAASHC